MMIFVVVVHVIVALFMILVVLLQPGNRGGAAAALGGAGSDTVFGARGANTFLSKLTFGAAVCFMLTNFSLSYMTSSRESSAVMKALEETKKGEVKQKEEPKAEEPVEEKAPEAEELNQ